MIRVLVLPDPLQTAIDKSARDAHPHECCGLLEGWREGDVVLTTAVHAARNLAEHRDRFEVDPADHIRVLKALRGTGRDIVGCYHSHPNGRAEPSSRDREASFGEDFVWVIAALEDKHADATVRAFVLTADGHREIDLEGPDRAP